MNQPTTSSALPGNVALYGTVEGRFAFLQAEASFLQTLLPPDVELAPQQYCPEGFHPLLLMFNYTHLESNTALERIAQEYKLGLALNYNEFIVMLPFVQFKNSAVNNEGPYCFLPVLYLDSILAVLGGRIFWEFNKELAHFNTSGINFKVSSELTNAPLFTAEFGLQGMPVVGTSLPNFKSIEPILQLPVLEYGPYGYISSIYTVAYQNAPIIPSVMSLTNNSCKYLPPGLLTSPSITQNVLGCFNLNYNWTLTYIKYIKP